eukprot:scaffold34462_cov56-Phaeocystis_antarctica.AAC.7
MCRGRIDWTLEAVHREGRTLNMRFMSMTPEVSKLSCWLNADARCRGSKGGHTVRNDVRAGRREAAGDRDARSVQGRARLQIRSRARKGAHVEHAVHGCDAGGVEAQRLAEGRRVLPRVKRGQRSGREGGGLLRGTQRAGEGSTVDSGQGAGRSAPQTCQGIRCGVRVRASRWVSNGGSEFRISNVQGRDRLQIGGRAQAEAHAEHSEHGCDAGGVEAQLLVERRRAVKHLVHRRDAGGIPDGNVRIEIRQVFEKPAHVRDGRDVPAGDRAVRRSGGSQVSVELLDRRHQGGLCRESGRAGPRTPARAIASGGEGRGARPRATDEQLVDVGQRGAFCGLGGGRAAGDRGARSVQGRARMQFGGRVRGGAHGEHAVHGCDAGGVDAQRLVERRRVLPRVERRACGAGRRAAQEAGGGGRPRRTQRAGEGSTADSGAGHGEERT